MIVVGVVVIAALYLAREVLIPITLAILLSFVLGPVVSLLRRVHLPRVPAVLFAVIVALTIIASLGSVIGVQIAALAPDVPRYASTIGQKINAVQNLTAGQLSRVIASLRDRIGGGSAGLASERAAPAGSAEASRQPVPVEVHQPNPGALQIAQRVLAPVLNPLETTLIVLIVAIFVLLQREDLRDRLIRLFGASDLHKTTIALDEAAHRLSRYFLSQLAINAASGAVIAVGLYLIGVPSPVLWGILGALLRFVPYIGSAIAAILPLIVAAGVSPGWMLALSGDDELGRQDQHYVAEYGKRACWRGCLTGACNDLLKQLTSLKRRRYQVYTCSGHELANNKACSPILGRLTYVATFT